MATIKNTGGGIDQAGVFFAQEGRVQNDYFQLLIYIHTDDLGKTV